MEANQITLHNLTKRYGDKIAVNISDLSIQPHTFTCIVGKSGCGKTTLLRLLAGLERPDANHIADSMAANPSGVAVNKVDPRGESPAVSISEANNIDHPESKTENKIAPSITGLPAKTAPVFQEPRLMPWLTVKENIMFSLKGNGNALRPAQTNVTKSSAAQNQNNAGLKQQPGHKAGDRPLLSSPASQPVTDCAEEQEDRCAQLLRELELTDAASLYPAQLSGGMAQRVSLGRTLFYDPDLILMDEPFSALDYFTRRNLQDMVLRLFRNQPKTILFVTHDVEEALLLGDRLLVMENGAIKADLPVPFPFPRNAADSEIQKMRRQILDLLA